MSDHVNSKCKTAFYHLYNIRQCAKFLSKPAVIALVNALVHSCIDYCNILLTGISKCTGMLYKIQRVQNYAAKLVANKNRLFPSLGLQLKGVALAPSTL